MQIWQCCDTRRRRKKWEKYEEEDIWYWKSSEVGGLVGWMSRDSAISCWTYVWCNIERVFLRAVRLIELIDRRDKKEIALFQL